MTAAVLAGLLFGLSAGLAPGPLLVLTLAQTLRHGTLEGVKVALSPLLTDAPIIAVVLLGLQTLTALDWVLGVIGLVGGAYVLYLSHQTWQLGPPDPTWDDGLPVSLRRGILVNALSPHPYLFWTTVGGPLVLQSAHNDRDWGAAAAFIACFYLCLVGVKVLLALGVGRFRRFLGGPSYRLLMALMSLSLAGYAGMLVFDAMLLLAGVGFMFESVVGDGR